MADFSVRMPGPGIGPGLNAFLDAYRAEGDRSMAQGQNQALMELRALQTEHARRGLAKEAALDEVRKALALMPDTGIPLSAERTVARPFTPVETATNQAPGLAAALGPDTVAGIPAPPQPTETLPAQTMQGLTMTGAMAALSPNMKAALLTPEGQVAAKARGALTEKDLAARRALAEAHQESLALMPQARAAVSEGDKIKFNGTMGALYQRQADILAPTDPGRAHDMRVASDTYLQKAVALQHDKREAALQGADLKAMGALLTKMREPGGATADNIAKVLTFDWTSERGQAEDWELQARGLKGIITKMVEPRLAPLLQGVLAKMDVQQGIRDPLKAARDAVREMGAPGFELLASLMFDKDKGRAAEWAMKVIGGPEATFKDVDLARQMVEETQADGTPGTMPGQPGYAGKVGVRLGQIRRPAEGAVQMRWEGTYGLRTAAEARKAWEAATKELNSAIKAMPKPSGLFVKPESQTAYEQYDQDVLGPMRDRVKEKKAHYDDMEKAEADRRAGTRPPTVGTTEPLPPPAGPAVPDALRGRSAGATPADRETRRINALARIEVLSQELSGRFQGDALKAEIKRRLLAEGIKPDDL